MSVHTFTIVPRQTTDAEFRAWVAALIAEATTGTGYWTQTADTGQINTTTVLAPTAVSQNRGYAIFTSTDGISPTITLKLEFGSGSSAATQLQILVSVGIAGTNGAGTLTSPNITQIGSGIRLGGEAGATSRNCRSVYSTTGGRFVWLLAEDSAAPAVLIIERFRVSDGTAAAGGVSLSTLWGVSTSNHASRGLTSTATSTEEPLTLSLRCQNANVYGADTYTGMVFASHPAHGALLSALCHTTGDIGSTVTFTTTHYSATRTFLTVPVLAGFTGNSAQSNARLAILYE